MKDDFDAYFRALVKKYEDKVLRYCFHILRYEEDPEEDAKDARQVVFEKLLQKEREGYTIDSYPCYLTTIAKRVCLNMLRARSVPRKKKEQGKGTGLKGISNRESELEDRLSRKVVLSPLFEIEAKYMEYERVDAKLLEKALLMSLLEENEDKEEVSQVLEICHYYFYDGMKDFEEIGETIGMSPSEVERLFANRPISFMSALEDMTLEEIADIKGISRSGVQKRLKKLEKLAQLKMKGDE